MDHRPAGIETPFQTPPAPGKAVEIAPGILWLRMSLPMALDHVNCYALGDDDGWTIVDTGLDTAKTRAAWQQALDGPLAGRPVARVLMTHHHPDHVGLAGWFQAEHGAEIWSSRTAWLLTRMLILDDQDRPTPETLVFWKRAGMDPDLLAQRAAERPFNFADVCAPLALGYRRLVDGASVQLAGRDWTVRMGDGHAPEQVTLWCADAPFVIGADQLLGTISPNLGVYATEPEADPVADWLDSCRRLLPFAREDHLVLPGHKLPFTGLPWRLSHLIENHVSALDRLEEALREERVASACFTTLFKREIGPAEYGLALVESVAHLNHLLQAGRVTRRLSDDGAWLWRRV